VGFRSLRENVDTTTAGGRLVFHLFGALAQFEREIIRDRTVAGLAAARARGRVGGRPSKLSQEQRRQARKMYDERELTVEQIGNVLGVSRTSIYRALGASSGAKQSREEEGAAPVPAKLGRTTPPAAAPRASRGRSAARQQASAGEKAQARSGPAAASQPARKRPTDPGPAW